MSKYNVRTTTNDVRTTPNNVRTTPNPSLVRRGVLTTQCPKNMSLHFHISENCCNFARGSKYGVDLEN